MVNAVLKRGEKVFNAYIVFTPFVLIVVGWLVIVGSARLFSLCSSVVNRNEWAITSSRHECTIGTKRKGVKFFFKFFFAWVWALGCGPVGVGAWVWARGCGCSGVGARVGRLGRRDGDGRARDMAGWIGIVALGWT